jgi:hypothetical protein
MRQTKKGNQWHFGMSAGSELIMDEWLRALLLAFFRVRGSAASRAPDSCRLPSRRLLRFRSAPGRHGGSGPRDFATVMILRGVARLLHSAPLQATKSIRITALENALDLGKD